MTGTETIILTLTPPRGYDPSRIPPRKLKWRVGIRILLSHR